MVIYLATFETARKVLKKGVPIMRKGWDKSITGVQENVHEDKYVGIDGDIITVTQQDKDAEDWVVGAFSCNKVINKEEVTFILNNYNDNSTFDNDPKVSTADNPMGSAEGTRFFDNQEVPLNGG